MKILKQKNNILLELGSSALGVSRADNKFEQYLNIVKKGDLFKVRDTKRSWKLANKLGIILSCHIRNQEEAENSRRQPEFWYYKTYIQNVGIIDLMKCEFEIL